ncbi:transposase [Microtetraspora malaysiensis]|uniref:transposase n=1 Tax=Microtetraspora malaysiensis TaxID=161358 RepID=UPI003D89BFD5
MICPRGAVSISWSDQVKSSGTPISRVQFAATDCRCCPLRPACTRASHKGRYGRSLTLLPRDQQEVLDQRRQQQLTRNGNSAMTSVPG